MEEGARTTRTNTKTLLSTKCLRFHYKSTIKYTKYIKYKKFNIRRGEEERQKEGEG